MIDAPNAAIVEGFVKTIAEKSGQRVDWHYFGGRALVKALGDLVIVAQTLRAERAQPHTGVNVCMWDEF